MNQVSFARGHLFVFLTALSFLPGAYPSDSNIARRDDGQKLLAGAASPSNWRIDDLAL